MQIEERREDSRGVKDDEDDEEKSRKEEEIIREANKLVKDNPGLRVAGVYSPPYGFENDSKEIEKINKMLFDSHADMLFVGMGVPKQDIFIYENMDKYKIPMSFSVGGTIDFLGGEQKRAPKWIRKIGFEWLFRFFENPKRMYQRYFVDDLKIISLFFKYIPHNGG